MNQRARSVTANAAPAASSARAGPRRVTATAATAAPAPAPAPRTQSGGAPARNTRDSAVTITTAGTMNARPPTTAPAEAADAAGAEDRELGRGRPGEQVAGRDRRLELASLDPAALLHDEPAQQRDVGRRTAEAGDPIRRHSRAIVASRNASGAPAAAASSRLAVRPARDTARAPAPSSRCSGPLVKTLRRRASRRSRAPEHSSRARPFKARAPRCDRDLRDDGEQRLAGPAAPVLGPHEQDPPARCRAGTATSRTAVKTARTRPGPSTSAISRLGRGLLPEQRLVQQLVGPGHLVGRPLVLGQLAYDHRQQQRARQLPLGGTDADPVRSTVRRAARSRA